MSDSHHRTERAWKDAEAFVERVEMAARSDMSANAFFEDLCAELRSTVEARTVSLWTVEASGRSVLARNGLAVHDGQDEVAADQFPSSDTFEPRSRWCDAPEGSSLNLVAIQKLHEDILIGLELRFEDAVDFATQKTLSEMVEAVLDLTAGVFMRSRVAVLHRRLDDSAHRDDFIRRLYEGFDLADSFASIAGAVAEKLSIDRVSMLRRRGSKWRMIATSATGQIDRRARQVRWLEMLTEELLQKADRFESVSADAHPSDKANGSMIAYHRESACKEFCVERIHNDDCGDDAAIVLEQFCDKGQSGRRTGILFDAVREPVARAAEYAIGRDEASLGLVARRMVRGSARRKLVMAASAMIALALAACLIPATLKIPVEGRVVAAERSRLFAPAQGIVADVLVSNGDRVRAGDTLVVLRSAELEFQRRKIQGALATAQTRLHSLQATRSGIGSDSGRDRGPGDSADEQVVKTEIDGLENQLKLLETQAGALTIVSPMDGRVDRWNLRQSLSARPVTHGQFLFDVVDDGGGWAVDLDLPEKNLNYVLQARVDDTCRCYMRLRSNPTKLFEGSIAEVADVAHLNPVGESVIRLTLPLTSESPVDLRAGATVAAQIHCGRRPIGFIWFRGLIEWSRRQGWLE